MPYYETNRISAYEQKMLFRTYEMVDWLQDKTGTPPEMSEALLGAWVGVLRYEVLCRAEKDEDFLQTIKNGKGSLLLNKELAPETWSNEELGNQISRETGLLHVTVYYLLEKVGEKFRELDEKKAYEPIGWVHINKDDGYPFSVNFWQDFLQPMTDEPPEKEDDESAQGTAFQMRS